jgi:hypothetical protein
MCSGSFLRLGFWQAMSLEDNFLGFHLIEDIISLDSIRQWHNFIEHETTGSQHLRSAFINNRLTQADAVSSEADQGPRGILIGPDTDPFAI